MQTAKYFAAAALLAVCALASAATDAPFWKGEDGQRLPETESMRSKDGFAGSLVITTDEDWEKRWNTPPEVRPNFNQAKVVPYGKKVFLLIFFSNASLDESGTASVHCDLKVVSPTGSVSLSQENVDCYTGRILGGPYNLYLSKPVIAFSGDPGDPQGEWSMEVNLRDERRGIELPLRATFQLQQHGG
jgi:hypothetical protein